MAEKEPEKEEGRLKNCAARQVATMFEGGMPRAPKPDARPIAATKKIAAMG